MITLSVGICHFASEQRVHLFMTVRASGRVFCMYFNRYLQKEVVDDANKLVRFAI